MLIAVGLHEFNAHFHDDYDRIACKANAGTGTEILSDRF